MKTGVIYRIWNRCNGKSYIGQTTQVIQKRFRAHFKPSNKCHALRKAIEKWGKDAFICEVIETNVDEILLNKMECLHIRFFDSVAPRGYNLTGGGEGISRPSLEVRQKLSEGQMGEKNHRFGKKFGPETISLETREKLSEVSSGENNSQFGVEPWNKGKRGIKSIKEPTNPLQLMLFE